MDLTTSPWKRGIAVVVAFAVFGAAAVFMIRAFDSTSTDRGGLPQESAPGDPRDVWQALPEGPLSPRHGALAFWVDGRVVAGRWAGLSSLSAHRELRAFGVGDAAPDPLRDPYGGMLDPTSGAWSDLPPRPERATEYGGPSVGGSRYVVTYQGAILDIAAGTWSALPASPVVADKGAAVVWAGDRLVVWGGFAWEDQGPRNPEGTLLSTGWSWRP